MSFELPRLSSRARPRRRDKNRSFAVASPARCAHRPAVAVEHVHTSSGTERGARGCRCKIDRSLAGSFAAATATHLYASRVTQRRSGMADDVPHHRQLFRPAPEKPNGTPQAKIPSCLPLPCSRFPPGLPSQRDPLPFRARSSPREYSPRTRGFPFANLARIRRAKSWSASLSFAFEPIVKLKRSQELFFT